MYIGYSCDGVGLRTVTQILMWGLDSPFSALVPWYHLMPWRPCCSVEQLQCVVVLLSLLRVTFSWWKSSTVSHSPWLQLLLESEKVTWVRTVTYSDCFFKHSCFFSSSLQVMQWSFHNFLCFIKSAITFPI